MAPPEQDDPDDPRRVDVPGDCPIPGTHRRLHDVHELWHDVAKAYGDPGRFRRSLNLAIQESRNVTWILQQEKHAIPGFDEWYAARQEAMRADPVMRWLVNARNRVVKQGDLKANSRARCTLILSWQHRQTQEFDVPPLEETDVIAMAVAETVPSDMRDQSVLKVERRWVVNDLADYELLDALAHIYGALSDLVDEAHLQAGHDFRTHMRTNDGFRLIRDSSIGGRLPCMQVSEELRTVSVRLSTGQLMRFQQTQRPVDEERGRIAMARYGFEPVPFGLARTPDELFRFGPPLVEVAKRVLRRDGSHAPMVFLMCPNGAISPHTFEIDGPEDKYLLWDSIAKDAEQQTAWGLVSIAEAWMARFDALNPGRRAQDAEDRVEVLDVTIAVEDGRHRSWMTVFRHVDDGIEFDETFVDETGLKNILEPVMKVWRRRRETSKS